MDPLVIILGTTASGKSSAAMALAHRAPVELISMDSMKIYRGMDLGTNKPTTADRARVPWHLVDVVDPADAFSAADFVRLAEAAMADIRSRNRRPVLVGGTALYLMGLLDGFFEGPGRNETLRAELEAQADRDGTPALHRRLQEVDPEAAGRLHPNDRKRLIRALEVFATTGRPISALQTQWDRAPRHEAILIGLFRSKEEESRRINARVLRMIDCGLVDEVRRLLDPAHTPRGLGPQAAQAVGYAEMIRHLRGEISLDQAILEIQQNSRKLAKSQRTWFKRLAKHRPLTWLEVANEATPEDLANQIKDRI